MSARKWKVRSLARSRPNLKIERFLRNIFPILWVGRPRLPLLTGETPVPQEIFGEFALDEKVEGGAIA
ncbi:MAG: hypothetical protein SAK29_05415 [Scytonema sp. PMC 1069.18]|nr:hypothetical protein [Scytonema sp. PMC 1069.18]MEC4880673.1 hypothetical protein [Scytonema sp. PMC 1070.18]